MRGECGLVGKDRPGVRRRAAVGLHDCGVGVDDVMRDGVLGKADARCVRTRTNAAEFDAWYGGQKCARYRARMSSSKRNGTARVWS
jgi:hypothetical protein